jgi:hypothetical protein
VSKLDDDQIKRRQRVMIRALASSGMDMCMREPDSNPKKVNICDK